MTQTNPLSGRFAAAASALALSLFLFGGTVATPSTAQASSPVAYVGIVA